MMIQTSELKKLEEVYMDSPAIRLFFYMEEITARKSS